MRAVVVAFRLRRTVLGAKDHREIERDHPTAMAAPTAAPDTAEDLRRLTREMGIDQASVPGSRALSEARETIPR